MTFYTSRLAWSSQAAFVASKYQYISLEKCLGVFWGRNNTKATETNFIKTARQIKSFNASAQILFCQYESSMTLTQP